MTKEDELKKDPDYLNIPKNIRFLVVDDLPLNLEMLKYFIESIDGIVTTARDGLIAIELFKSNSFDIIIMDIMMPEMDGLDATREIRKLPGGELIPIIGLSANVLETDKQTCYSAGMSGFIAKPLDFKLLLSMVEKFLNTYQHKADTNELKTLETVSKTSLDITQKIPLDIDAYINRMGGNKEISELIIKGFIQQIPIMLNNIENAIGKNDIKTVEREAHSIKGGASNVFAEELMQAAKELELHAKEDQLYKASELLEKIRKEFERLHSFVGGFIHLP